MVRVSEMSWPDYFDIWLHFAIGLDNFKVVNIAGFSNSELIVSEADRANNLFESEVEYPEIAAYLVPCDADAYIVSCSCPDDEIIDMLINDTRKMQFKRWHKFKIPYRVEPDFLIRFTSDNDAYINAQLLLLKRGLQLG